MPNARLAEFLLRRVTTPDRASAIAGDLLEQYPHRPFRFALAVVRVLLALQWQQMLGFAAASIAYLLPAIAFTRITLRYLSPVLERQARYRTSASAAPLMLGSMALLAVAAYSLAKPSTRRVAAVSFLLAVTTFTGACSIFIYPVFHGSIWAAVLAITLLLIAVPATRRAGLLSMATSTVLCLTVFVVLGLASDLYHPHGRKILRYDLALAAFTWIVAVAAGALTLGALQRRFAPTPPPVVN